MEIINNKKLIDDIIPTNEKIPLTNNEIMPNVEINETNKKASYTLPIKEKKTSLFSNLFRRQLKIPTHDLPSADYNVILNTNNKLNIDRKEPLHIPSTNLPQLDLSLPICRQFEINNGQSIVPTIDLLPMSLPDTDKHKQTEISNINLSEINEQNNPMKLSDVNEKENLMTNLIEEKLPEISLETNINLPSSIDTDYQMKIDSVRMKNRMTFFRI